MKNKKIEDFFFKDIKHAELEMKYGECISKKREKIASDYFEINKDIELIINKKYFFSNCNLYKNSFYINNCFIFGNMRSKLLHFYVKKESITLEKSMNGILYDLINEPNEISIYLNKMYEDQIEARLKIRNNLKNIRSHYNDEIKESSMILMNIIKILNKIELSGTDIFTYMEKEKIYEAEAIYKTLENIQDTILLLQDINITEELDLIKKIINKS